MTYVSVDYSLMHHLCKLSIVMPQDYYSKSLHTALSDTAINDDYANSILEMVISTLSTGVLGFMWGAVAGAWGTIFAANALAGQSYAMKLRQVKEFCKIKGLSWGVRAKLVAYYEHLYPDEVIVNELEIVNDLPAVMREELVREMCE